MRRQLSTGHVVAQISVMLDELDRRIAQLDGEESSLDGLVDRAYARGSRSALLDLHLWMIRQELEQCV